MGSCLNRSNNKKIIKVSESYKKNKISKKTNNKNKITLTHSESEAPKFNNSEISKLSQVSIHSLCPKILSNEIDLTAIKSNYSSIDKNHSLQEITQIIHI